MTRTLGRMLARSFKTGASKGPSYRKERDEAKRLAGLCGCTIERFMPGWNVWPPKGIDADPLEGDHYCQDWPEVLDAVKRYHDISEAQRREAVEMTAYEAAYAAANPPEPTDSDLLLQWADEHAMRHVSRTRKSGEGQS